MDAVTNVPPPVNEPIRQYAPGSGERAVLEARVKELAGERAELTMTTGGRQRMGGGDRVEIVQPHNYRHVLGELGNVTEQDVASAIESARQAAPGWRELSYDDRAAIFLKAAELLAGPWRATINASTILGQSKSVYQAEIDAACELIDFWRYNVHFGRRLLAEQPDVDQQRLEPAGVPPARRLRAGRHAVQFHLDRRQPADRARADGQHGDLEAVAHPATVGALPDAPAGGGRAAARRDQHGDRRRPDGVQGRAGPRGPGRHSLHRLDRDLPDPVAHRRAEHFQLPQLPAAGRRDRRQGLRHRPPVGRPRRADHGADPRRVRVPGPEVLGGVAGLRGALGLGPDGRRLRLGRAVAGHGRRIRRLLPVHGRGDRRQGIRRACRRAGPGQDAGVDPGAGRRRRERRRGVLRAADRAGVHGSDGRGVHHGVLRPDPRGARLRRRGLRPAWSRRRRMSRRTP